MCSLHNLIVCYPGLIDGSENKTPDDRTHTCTYVSRTSLAKPVFYYASLKSNGEGLCYVE